MAQTLGFMLYVLGLGLGLAICVLDSITEAFTRITQRAALRLFCAMPSGSKHFKYGWCARFAGYTFRPQCVRDSRLVRFRQFLCESIHLRITLRSVQTLSETDAEHELRCS